jgi:hypothetical protein
VEIRQREVRELPWRKYQTTVVGWKMGALVKRQAMVAADALVNLDNKNRQLLDEPLPTEPEDDEGLPSQSGSGPTDRRTAMLCGSSAAISQPMDRSTALAASVALQEVG